MSKTFSQILESSRALSIDDGLAAVRVILETLDDIRFMWHPLGFVHARLFTSGDSALRLHLWPSQNRRPQQPYWPIHTHIFHLESLVLAGELQNSTYTVSPKDGGPYRLYDVSYSSSDSTINATATTVELSESKLENLSAGQSYEVAPGVFHATRVELDVDAATLVRTHVVQNSPPMVAGDAKGEARFSYERASCEPSLVKATLERLP